MNWCWKSSSASTVAEFNRSIIGLGVPATVNIKKPALSTSGMPSSIR